MSTSDHERTRTDHLPVAHHQLGLPWPALLALSTAACVTLLTEGLPVGVLPEMARGLSVSEAAIGQAITIYAITTGLSAIPLARATARWSRRRLLLCRCSRP